MTVSCIRSIETNSPAVHRPRGRSALWRDPVYKNDLIEHAHVTVPRCGGHPRPADRVHAETELPRTPRRPCSIPRWCREIALRNPSLARIQKLRQVCRGAAKTSAGGILIPHRSPIGPISNGGISVNRIHQRQSVRFPASSKVLLRSQTQARQSCCASWQMVA